MRWLTELIFPKRLHRLGYIWRILATNLTAGVIIASTSPTEQLPTMVGLIAICAYQLFYFTAESSRYWHERLVGVAQRRSVRVCFPDDHIGISCSRISFWPRFQ